MKGMLLCFYICFIIMFLVFYFIFYNIYEKPKDISTHVARILKEFEFMNCEIRKVWLSDPKQAFYILKIRASEQYFPCVSEENAKNGVISPSLYALYSQKELKELFEKSHQVHIRKWREI